MNSYCKWCGGSLLGLWYHTKYGNYCCKEHAKQGDEFRREEIKREKAAKVRKLEKKLAKLKK